MTKIPFEDLQVGSVLVREFFVVAMVPPSGEGFYVCGGAAGFTNAKGQPDAIAPCITTERSRAEGWFKDAVEKARGCSEGKVVLIRFDDGKIDKLVECVMEGAQSTAA